MLKLCTNHFSVGYEAARVQYPGNFRKLGNGIYSGKILTDDICEDVLERVRYFDVHTNADRRVTANSMHQNAVLSSEIGIEPLVDALVEMFVEDISPKILPERYRLPIDTTHSYIVRYGASSDRDLGFHVDDSFLTLNICLNEGFTGSELVFEGERCPTHIDTDASEHERIRVDHKKGFMIVHSGKNRHFVDCISSGERSNLIIWCQSEAERERWFAAQNSGECLEFCGKFPKPAVRNVNTGFD